MARARWLVSAVGMFVVIAALGAACGGGGGGKSSAAAPQPTVATSPTPPATADAGSVLASFVQQQLGKTYAGDCAQAKPETDAGKICSIAKGQRENLSAYQLQPVAAKPTNWLILQTQGANVSVAQSISITPDTVAVPGVPWPLRTGVDLVVAGSDPCVNVREGPSLGQKAVDCIKDGTKVRLVAGPSPADSIQWWQVEGRTGWVAGDYLRYPDAAR